MQQAREGKASRAVTFLCCLSLLSSILSMRVEHIYVKDITLKPKPGVVVPVSTWGPKKRPESTGTGFERQQDPQGSQEAQMEPRKPKWSPGNPNRAQEAQMEPRRPKWSPGGPNGAQEAQMEPRKPKWSPGGPNGAQEAQMEPRSPKWSPGGPNRAQEAQMEPSRPQVAQIEPRKPQGAKSSPRAHTLGIT